MRQPLNLPSFFLPHLLSYSSFDVEKEYLYSIPILFVIFTIRKMTSATNRKVITETRKSSIPKICFHTVAARVERFPIPGRARPIIGIMTSFTSDCTTIPRYYPGLVQILRMIELSINYMRRVYGRHSDFNSGSIASIVLLTSQLQFKERKPFGYQRYS